MLKTILLSGTFMVMLAGPATADFAAGSHAYGQGQYATAAREYLAAARTGNSPSQYMLGRLYEEGRGVRTDLSHAYAWYDVSAKYGYQNGERSRDRLIGEMSDWEVQSGKNLSSRWMAGNMPSNLYTNVSSSEPRTTAMTAPTTAPYSVAAVQSALNTLGYAAGSVDGKLGPNTRAAVSAYQLDSGLPTSGQPSVSLHEHLQATLHKSRASGSSAALAATQASDAALIAEVQQELRWREYSVPQINGRLDAATVAAIRSYQADASLSVDGRVSDKLLTMLRSGRQDAGADYRAQVKSVQQALNQRGFNAGPADGALGPKTRTAIREYESSKKLPVTGEMSASLLQSLSLGTPQSTPVSGEDPTAADVESELSRLGYAVGPVDGVLDNQAQAAIRYYQRTYGLGVTGDASEGLLEHLRDQREQNNGETLSKLVLNVEEELVRHGYRTGTVDGTVDVDTRGAILDFQSRSGADIDGKVSAKLLRNLQDTPVAGGSDSGGDTLLTDSEVREVETHLQQLGYRVGPVDGVQDTTTSTAVRDYQTNAGLEVTGRIDHNLLRTLRMDMAAATEATPSSVISDVIRLLNRQQ